MLPLEDDTSRFITTWMQLRQIIQAANFNRFQQAGLSATQFMTLNAIPETGLILSDLARRLNLSPATLNATVNSLEERGLVRRTRHTEDARKVNIKATTQGMALQNSTSSEFHAFMAGIFHQMSKTRRKGLLAGLEQMVKLSAENQKSLELTRRMDDAAPATHSARLSRKQ